MDDLTRALGFLRAFARRRSPREIAVPAFSGELPRDAPAAERLRLEELLPALRRDWRRSLPEAPDDVIDHLARRAEVRLLGADLVGFRGVRAPDGELAARADLYVHDGVAQIEDVFTVEEHRSARARPRADDRPPR